MRWAKRAGVKLFRLSSSTGRSSRKSQVFRLDPPVTPVGKLGRKKLSRENPFSNVKESPIWASAEKGRFRLTDKSDCVRNGLTSSIPHPKN